MRSERTSQARRFHFVAPTRRGSVTLQVHAENLLEAVRLAQDKLGAIRPLLGEGARSDRGSFALRAPWTAPSRPAG